MKLVATYGEIAFQEEQEIIFCCIIFFKCCILSEFKIFKSSFNCCHVVLT